MKLSLIISAFVVLISTLTVVLTDTDLNASERAGCEAFIYISNNSLFEINLTVDGIGVGHLLIGKNKTYPINLLNDEPKKIKVKIEYLDPDYIEPKSFFMVTKNKLECGMTDTMYVAFSK